MATISVEDLKKMKVSDLKKELKDRGLLLSGTKDVLLERLQAALYGTAVSDVTTESSAVDDTDSVEKSIDQLVGDTAPTAPAAPEESTPEPVVTSKENIPEKSEEIASEAAKQVVSPSDLSEADRLKARAEKFGGAVSDSAKKLMRAERFGLSTSSLDRTGTVGLGTSAAKPEDMDKMKKRAERFGMVVSNKLSKVDEDEKKRKRLERFGGVSASPIEVKKVKLTSTDSDTEEKKKKRAERFGLT